jgi:DMSO/TMAO reductase YedYZ molybdopterin-dependent catalytic subunit
VATSDLSTPASQPDIDSTTARPPRAIGRRYVAPFIAGAIAAGVSIGVSELIAGLVSGAPSLVIAMGTLAIDLQPPGAKDFVVSLFGTNDKLALNLFIVAVAVVIAGAIGIAGSRDIRRADIGFVTFGAIALFAAYREPLVSFPLAIVTTVAAVAAGLAALRYLLGLIAPPKPQAEPVAGTTKAARREERRLRQLGIEPVRTAHTTAGMPDWDRRRFLLGSAGVAAGAVVVGVFGRRLTTTRATAEPSAALTIPKPAETVPPLTADEMLSVPGITPIVIPNDDFYRIDTALLPVRLDASTWKLTVNGMVNQEVTLTYQQLTTMPMFEQYVTIQCVSNYVGGDLVGNAKWTGVNLRDVLAMAGVQPAATQIVGRSADGWTAGFPTEHAMDPARNPMIAVLMNDQPLPTEHGYPARLIVPGLYGYVSATKWLTNIELTTLEAFDGYWVPLGWAKLGPILTQSRIDVPHDGQNIKAGTVTIAGVAWAPDRGVSTVEVQVDEGAWQNCILSAPISKATWLQWELLWTATPGIHTIAVRATDGTGAVQTADVTPPAPDGARGHHTIQVAVGT